MCVEGQPAKVSRGPQAHFSELQGRWRALEKPPPGGLSSWPICAPRAPSVNLVGAAESSLRAGAEPVAGMTSGWAAGPHPPWVPAACECPELFQEGLFWLGDRGSCCSERLTPGSVGAQTRIGRKQSILGSGRDEA